MIRTWLVACALLFASTVAADVQLRVKDARGGVSTISGNGQVARIDDAARAQYVIIDFQRNEMQMVDPARGEVAVSRLAEAGASAAAPIDIRLRDRGDGPRIAGYETRKLVLRAEGEHCGTVFASARLLKEPGVRPLFESLRGVQRMAQGMSAKFGGMLDRCQRANLQLADALERHGVPMRVLDQQGRLVTEVLEVDTDKRIAADHYRVPGGMARIDMDRQIDQAMQHGREMMKNLPDMGEMMQQMQQRGGDLTPEMRQQLESMQEMLQQMEPQR